jgi:hypothetical protein
MWGVSRPAGEKGRFGRCPPARRCCAAGMPAPALVMAELRQTRIGMLQVLVHPIFSRVQRTMFLDHGPGSRLGCGPCVRCSPPRQRRPRFIPARARSTRRYTYTHFLSLAQLTHLSNSIGRVSGGLVHLGRFIWTRVPNLPVVIKHC